MSARATHPGPERLPGGFLQEDASSWQRIRRHAVPGWMIERATAHRLAGEWEAACAAAAVDVTFTLPELAACYGTRVAEAVEDDLRHLAPDLVRWHLPRTLGGRTTLKPGVRVLLARYGEGPDAPVLSATTGPMVDGPQRLGLHCELRQDQESDDRYTFSDSFRFENWIAARPLWDGRHTGELRDRLTAGAARLPFFAPDGTPLTEHGLPAAAPGTADPAAHAEWIALLCGRGEFAEAYEAAGIERDLTVPEASTVYGRPPEPGALTKSRLLDLTRLEAEVRRLQAAGEGDRFRIPLSWNGNLAAEPTGSRGLKVSLLGRQEAPAVPRLPLFAWSRLPDLDLVRTGRITPAELHPLVAAALFPEAGPAAGPPAPARPEAVRVRCRGEWHEVRSQGGVLDLLRHSAEEQQRERAMRAFGGAIAGCFAVQHDWTTGKGRLPRALKVERRELFLRAQHGDTPGVTALLDAGTDPRVRDGRGYTLLHVLNLLDHEELLPRLLAAGLDREARSVLGGLTPLQVAVQYGGSADLVKALLEAGCRIDVIDEAELSLAQLIRRYQRTDLAFLRKRVEEEFPDIGAEWFDEWMEFREEDEEDEGEDEGEGEDA